MLAQPAAVVMRYFAVALDYDGTLASHGQVAPATVAALERAAALGRRLVLVTGRQIEELERVFPRISLFAQVVDENGAVLYEPSSGWVRELEQAPPASFVTTLRARGVDPIAVGRVIVATWEPHQATVLDTIRAMGLELHVEFNKGAIMVLPAGVTKRTGLSVALDDLGLSPHNVVAVGDAENDHAFLTYCGCAVTVANALPALKAGSDWVTPGRNGQGVIQLLDRLLADDLHGVAGSRWAPVVARCPTGASAGEEVSPASPAGRPPGVLVDSQGMRVLVLDAPPGEAAAAGAGRGIGRLLLERLSAVGLQLGVVDPDGTHADPPGAAVVGRDGRAPSVEEVTALLEQHPRRSVVAVLHRVASNERWAWLRGLLGRVGPLRARWGRPHWIVVHDAHRVLPAPSALPPDRPALLGGIVLETPHPAGLPSAVLDDVDVVLAAPEFAEASLAGFARATGKSPPRLPAVCSGANRIVAWRVAHGPAIAAEIPSVG